MAIKEFEPILWQFALGNFIRVDLGNNLIKRARLLKVDLDFDDLSSFSCTFGNLITTKDEIDKHAELMRQAVTAGKQVAASAGNWQKAYEQSSAIANQIQDGLVGAVLEVGKDNNQDIQIGPYGIWGRKKKEGSDTDYEDEQFRLMSNKLLFSSDGFKTARGVFGKFTVNGEEKWGVMSDAVVSGYISGSTIEGGSLKIGGQGGTFVVNSDGSVEILDARGSNAYASKTDMQVIEDARRFHTEILYTGSTIFSEPDSSCTLTAKVYSWDTDITDVVMQKGAKFSWIRASRGNDTQWNIEHANQPTNTIDITNDSIPSNAQFSVQVVFDDEGL